MKLSTELQSVPYRAADVITFIEKTPYNPQLNTFELELFHLLTKYIVLYILHLADL